MERRRWREVSLVVLGVVLHSLYMLSIFDIYFKSPIVTGMQLEPPNIQAPANRLVLFIGTLLLRFLLSLMSWSFIFRWKCEPDASVWRKDGVLGKFTGHDEFSRPWKFGCVFLLGLLLEALRRCESDTYIPTGLIFYEGSLDMKNFSRPCSIFRSLDLWVFALGYVTGLFYWVVWK